MLLHYASLLVIIQALEVLCNWPEEQQTAEELNSIYRQTAWHLAAGKVKLEALGELWECANEEITPQESSNKFMVHKDDKERTDWYVVAKMCNLSLLNFKRLSTIFHVLYRTANLQSYILYICSTNIGTEYFKQGIHSQIFPLQIVVCFIILTYLVPVLFTFYIQGVLKLKKK